jgi:hypothetical protein
MNPEGRPAKPGLSDDEFVAVDALLRRGSYKGSGLRAAANLVSALRGAPTASTPKAKAKRTVSPRWLGRQLEKRGKNASAAKLAIVQRRAKARRNSSVADYTGTRIGREIPPGGSS